MFDVSPSDTNTYLVSNSGGLDNFTFNILKTNVEALDRRLIYTPKSIERTE